VLQELKNEEKTITNDSKLFREGIKYEHWRTGILSIRMILKYFDIIVYWTKGRPPIKTPVSPTCTSKGSLAEQLDQGNQVEWTNTGSVETSNYIQFTLLTWRN